MTTEVPYLSVIVTVIKVGHTFLFKSKVARRERRLYCVYEQSPFPPGNFTFKKKSSKMGLFAVMPYKNHFCLPKQPYSDFVLNNMNGIFFC